MSGRCCQEQTPKPGYPEEFAFPGTWLLSQMMKPVQALDKKKVLNNKYDFKGDSCCLTHPAVKTAQLYFLPQNAKKDPDGALVLPPGTRIIYDRKFLMECRNSPIAKTPPSDLPDIPGVTSPNVEELKIENNHVQTCDEKVSAGEEEQFDMDI
ncbi:PREDICTED: eukaryotic translation initiation factor 4E-binding protein 1 [Calidris pugnax]|uniref:eukaryotic translation initiation factor 4E-binding protein 1 n=1 Tax=Calidris pugnax TaxID=198806 RepID=UPI00071D4AA6|nr:PREDICTED: eukaryotic translation initiation factor 4E-binding protein 1 [Calidris pugnax]